MTLVESWDPRELESLEDEAKVRSFALDPAWSEAARLSGYASPRALGLKERGVLRAVCVGLRRSKAGFSKVVCGTNGGVGMLAADPSSGADLIRCLWRRWHPSELQIFGVQRIPGAGVGWEPSYTIHVDLERSMDEVAVDFRKQTRQSLSRALESGVTATAATGGDVEKGLDMIAMTAEEKGFKLPPKTYLAALHQTFARSGLSEFIVAKREDRIVAAVHVLGARGIASWWKGGATREGYLVNAPTVALWTAMQVAAERGFKKFDLGGTHPTDPKFKGIHRYKSSFGGRLVQTFVGRRSTVAARAARRLSSIIP